MTVAASVRTTGAARRGRRRSLRLSPLVAASLGFLVLFVVAAVFGTLIAPYGAGTESLGVGVIGPSAAHWLGTDQLGQDIFSRVVIGSRTALAGPLLVAVGSALIGGPLGVLSGYLGGWVDTVIMRWADLMYALPGLLVMIVVAGVIGGSYLVAVLLLVLFLAPYTARIVRAAALEQRSLAYVEAARVLGVSRRRVMALHIGPNVLAELIATAAYQYAMALLILSTLAFLGIGVTPDSPDWGLMASANESLLFENPAAMLAPAGLIVLAAASANIVGDWAYEHLSRRGRSR